MIRLEIGLEIRHGGIMCAIEDKTAVAVVASYRSVSEIPFVLRPWTGHRNTSANRYNHRTTGRKAKVKLEELQTIPVKGKRL